MDTLPDFRLIRPSSAREAVEACQREPGARFLAGGTDVVPALRRGLDEPETLIDLSDVAELHGIDERDGGCSIGAAETLAEITANPMLRARFPALVEAAETVAAPAHRTVATIGGNLCLDTRCVFYNQSEWWRTSNDYCLKYRGDICHVAPSSKRCVAAYSGDLAPALLVYGAEIEIAGPDTTRRLALADLFVEDGAAHLSLEPGELVVRIDLPAPPPGMVSAYTKGRLRGAIDFPLAGVAVALRLNDGRLDDLRIAVTGTNSRPFLAAKTEALLGRPVDDTVLDEISALVRGQAKPLRSTITAPNHRRRIAAAFARRLVERLSAD